MEDTEGIYSYGGRSEEWQSSKTKPTISGGNDSWTTGLTTTTEFIGDLEEVEFEINEDLLDELRMVCKLVSNRFSSEVSGVLFIRPPFTQEVKTVTPGATPAEPTPEPDITIGLKDETTAQFQKLFVKWKANEAVDPEAAEWKWAFEWSTRVFSEREGKNTRGKFRRWLRNKLEEMLPADIKAQDIIAFVALVTSGLGEDAPVPAPEYEPFYVKVGESMDVCKFPDTLHTDEKDRCGAVINDPDTKEPAWKCSRVKGHTGMHEAGQMIVGEEGCLARWKPEETAPVAPVVPAPEPAATTEVKVTPAGEKPTLEGKCLAKYRGANGNEWRCLRPKGHTGFHSTTAEMKGGMVWSDGASGAVPAIPVENCGDVSPTGGYICNLAKGHAGSHKQLGPNRQTVMSWPRTDESPSGRNVVEPFVGGAVRMCAYGDTLHTKVTNRCDAQIPYRTNDGKVAYWPCTREVLHLGMHEAAVGTRGCIARWADEKTLFGTKAEAETAAKATPIPPVPMPETAPATTPAPATENVPDTDSFYVKAGGKPRKCFYEDTWPPAKDYCGVCVRDPDTGLPTWQCTRQEGHTGMHEAGHKGGTCLARWVTFEPVAPMLIATAISHEVPVADQCGHKNGRWVCVLPNDHRGLHIGRDPEIKVGFYSRWFGQETPQPICSAFSDQDHVCTKIKGHPGHHLGRKLNLQDLTWTYWVLTPDGKTVYKEHDEDRKPPVGTKEDGFGDKVRKWWRGDDKYDKQKKKHKDHAPKETYYTYEPPAPKRYVIYKYFLPHQDNTGGGTLFDREQLQTEYGPEMRVALGVMDKPPKEKLELEKGIAIDIQNANGWWHSHVDGAPGWSGVDSGNIEKWLTSQKARRKNQYVFSIVFGHNGTTFKFRTDIRKVLEDGSELVFTVPCRLHVIRNVKVDADAINKKIDEKLVPPKTKVSWTGAKPWTGFGSGYYGSGYTIKTGTTGSVYEKEGTGPVKSTRADDDEAYMLVWDDKSMKWVRKPVSFGASPEWDEDTQDVKWVGQDATELKTKSSNKDKHSEHKWSKEEIEKYAEWKDAHEKEMEAHKGEPGPYQNFIE